MELFSPGNLCRLIPVYGQWRSADMAAMVKESYLPPVGSRWASSDANDGPLSLILEVVLYPAGMVKAYKVLVEDTVCFVGAEALVRFLEED